MMSEINFAVREMTFEDIDKVHELWMTIHGFGIRSLDDSKEYVERFIKRNPTTSIVAVKDDEIIGSILCGHDGRHGCFYHVCVKEKYRQHGVGRAMVSYAMLELKKEKISKVTLVAFKNNEVGNLFWKGVGWTFRDDFNYYELSLNDENITQFNM
ncbi:MAG: GNAT family N-acetyltransferase [Lachnospiraceae bacterium]|nr:GNAT family N-acetyltransferase [Lachnospiraceae bacterium]